MDKLYSTQDVAAIAGIKYQMMLKHIKAGSIQGQKIGPAWVFTQEQVDNFIKSRRGPGRPPTKKE